MALANQTCTYGRIESIDWIFFKLSYGRIFDSRAIILSQKIGAGHLVLPGALIGQFA